MPKNAGVALLPLIEGLRAVGAVGLRYAADSRRVAGAIRAAPAGLFLREWLEAPAGVGAVWPSSERLARSMAARVDPQGAGLVVELGAGTGVVTQALLDRGVPAERLRVVECAPAFVHHLRRRFPGVTILQGDAARLSDMLGVDAAGAAVDAIVSSLPLRSLDPDIVSAVLDQCRTLLRPGCPLIQFTYVWRGLPVAGLSDGFVSRSDQAVWANLPPARVIALERAA
ncbi:class I SAM-dependent methyltransferase [Castellaniella hirudinis]|uniref:Class I SAM-dependent methyltransferase n=1 Tax=Castellaniella hirudinis TaxID=1144617 RepID=A0ABV8S1P2_9BURK